MFWNKEKNKKIEKLESQLFEKENFIVMLADCMKNKEHIDVSIFDESLVNVSTGIYYNDLLDMYNDFCRRYKILSDQHKNVLNSLNNKNTSIKVRKNNTNRNF